MSIFRSVPHVLWSALSFILYIVQKRKKKKKVQMWSEIGWNPNRSPVQSCCALTRSSLCLSYVGAVPSLWSKSGQFCIPWAEQILHEVQLAGVQGCLKNCRKSHSAMYQAKQSPACSVQGAAVWQLGTGCCVGFVLTHREQRLMERISWAHVRHKKPKKIFS